MGNSTSNNIVCPNCCIDVKLDNPQPKQQYSCPRCGGLLPPVNKKPNDTQLFLPLQRVILLPFFESLKDFLNNEDDEKQNELNSNQNNNNLSNFDHNSLIESHIRPYFEEKPTVLTSGQHIYIKKIHFKIISCYPPEGIAGRDSKYIVKYNNNSILHNNKIRKIHILPLDESYKTLFKKTNGKGNNDDTKVNGQIIFQKHIKPYISSNDIVLNNPNNNNNSITNIGRHFIRGQIFKSNGIEFCVMEQEPFNGYITPETSVHLDGTSLKDIKELEIKPILETLPNNHKNFNQQQIIDHYLRPYFEIGLYRYLDFNVTEDLYIDGAEFRIKKMIPKNGVVTGNVNFKYDGKPMTSEELRKEQEEKDLEFARQLQAQERNSSPFNQIFFRNISSNGRSGLQRRVSPFSNNNNDPQTNNRGNRPQIDGEQLIRMLFSDMQNGNGGIRFLIDQREIERYREEERKKRALPKELINRLPTYKYNKKEEKTTNTKDENDNENQNENDKLDEHYNCRICLESYQQDEDIKILPCMHQYHSDCIDHWLSIHRKCPICNFEIDPNGLR